MVRTARWLAPLTVLLALGCGTARVRWRQDWSEVEDPRLFKACHVTDWGAGVWLAHTPKGSYVLTCSHLVGKFSSVKVFLMDPERLDYERFEADVVARSHPHKEDLALLRLQETPSFAKPFRTKLAPPFSEGEERKVAIMATAFGADDRPFALGLPLLQQSIEVESVLPDEEKTVSSTVSKGLLHGGISQATSGSAVFDGDGLAGLAESSPGFGKRLEPVPDNPDEKREALLIGVVTSLPSTIQSFLEEHGHAHLVVPAPPSAPSKESDAAAK